MPIIVSSATLPFYRSRLVWRRTMISLTAIVYFGAIGAMTYKIFDGFKPQQVQTPIVPVKEEIKPEVKPEVKGDKDGNKTKSKRS